MSFLRVCFIVIFMGFMALYMNRNDNDNNCFVYTYFSSFLEIYVLKKFRKGFLCKKLLIFRRTDCGIVKKHFTIQFL